MCVIDLRWTLASSVRRVIHDTTVPDPVCTHRHTRGEKKHDGNETTVIVYRRPLVGGGNEEEMLISQK